MAFPTTPIDTTNLDSDSDSPALARVDLLDAVTKLNTIIDEAGEAGGVCVLNGSAQIPSTALPLTLNPEGVLTLAPSTNIVNIQDILRLTAQPKADVLALTTSSLTTGDVALVSDASGGAASLAMYVVPTGWKYISTSTWATLS